MNTIPINFYNFNCIIIVNNKYKTFLYHKTHNIYLTMSSKHNNISLKALPFDVIPFKLKFDSVQKFKKLTFSSMGGHLSETFTGYDFKKSFIKVIENNHKSTNPNYDSSFHLLDSSHGEKFFMLYELFFHIDSYNKKSKEENKNHKQIIYVFYVDSKDRDNYWIKMFSDYDFENKTSAYHQDFLNSFQDGKYYGALDVRNILEFTLWFTYWQILQEKDENKKEELLKFPYVIHPSQNDHGYIHVRTVNGTSICFRSELDFEKDEKNGFEFLQNTLQEINWEQVIKESENDNESKGTFDWEDEEWNEDEDEEINENNNNSSTYKRKLVNTKSTNSENEISLDEIIGTLKLNSIFRVEYDNVVNPSQLTVLDWDNHELEVIRAKNKDDEGNVKVNQRDSLFKNFFNWVSKQNLNEILIYIDQDDINNHWVKNYKTLSGDNQNHNLRTYLENMILKKDFKLHIRDAENWKSNQTPFIYLETKNVEGNLKNSTPIKKILIRSENDTKKDEKLGFVFETIMKRVVENAEN